MELGGFYKTNRNQASFKYLLQIFKYVTLVIEVMLQFYHQTAITVGVTM